MLLLFMVKMSFVINTILRTSGLHTSCILRSCILRSCILRSCILRSCILRSCILRSCILRGCILRSWNQYAITGYGVPLPDFAYYDIKSHVDTLRSSDFDDELTPKQWTKHKNRIVGMTKPIAYVNDNYYSRTSSLVLFLNPVEIHNTDTMLNNNIYGPYVNPKDVYLKDINSNGIIWNHSNVYYGSKLPYSRDDSLCRLLWLASINPDYHTLMQTKTRKQTTFELSDDPYGDWLAQLNTKYKTKRDCFGLYIVGI